MLNIARERVAAEGLTNVEFQEFDGEALDVPADSFDAAVCRWGLMFLPSPDRAVSGMHDALRPGGRIAVATWSVPPKVPFLSAPMGVLRRALDLPPPPPNAPGPFSLANPEALSKLLTTSGFGDVSVEPFEARFEYETVDLYLDSLRDLAAPIVALVSGQPAERQAELWQAIADAMAPFTSDAGVVELPSEALIASGRRPN
jgi:ubiquinone/menaquinone biosynthesis C-methylase UbiE